MRYSAVYAVDMLVLPSQLLLLALLPFHSLGHRQATQDDDASERGVGLTGVTETSSSAYGRRHALVIGIDEYQDAAFPGLKYAVADARAVAKILIDRYGFESEDVRLIVNEDATKVALDKALEDWACDQGRVGEEDLFVVFFAGHGVTRPGRREARGYIVPVDGQSEADGAPTWSSLIGMNDVEDISELVPAKHALFILDCCFGGLAVTRAAPPVAAGLSNRARQVITAGNAQQAVLDAGGGGHSVFTGALLGGLEGDADLDGDQVVTFGELFNHVGREVERRTEKRQTPLQATFPDHEGGNVALFAPGVKPGAMSAAERLKALERSEKEQLAEVKRLSDALLTRDLVAEADGLWPPHPEMIPRYRDWIDRAQALIERKAQHEESVRQVAQEAYLSQVVAGQLEEGEGSTMDWSMVDPDLRWRHETFGALVAELEALATGLLGNDMVLERHGWSVAKRLAFAEELKRGFAEGGEYDRRWREASWEISADYPGLSLGPQMGLVPRGPDPYSGLWEFWHVQTGAEPVRGEDGKLEMEESTGLVFVLLVGGKFWMGAQSRSPQWRNFEEEARYDEGPVHEIELTTFLLSKWEMTHGQWSRVMARDRSSWRGNAGSRGIDAVARVSWMDCVELMPNLGLSLPTEAQWEYACRAGRIEKGTFTPLAPLDYVTLRGQSFEQPFAVDEASRRRREGVGAQSPVGPFPPNAFGIHDMVGSVWEWCLDGYSMSFYHGSPPTDPVNVLTDSDDAVYRGGGFTYDSGSARSAFRTYNTPRYVSRAVGVRPAMVITD
jgi:formylglycine-generating enzyme required for sulfatase activity